MSRSRAPIALGLAAASGVGYYLYQSGGNAKAAEKQFEADVHKVSAKVKGAEPSVVSRKTDAAKYGAQAGAKIDAAVAKTDAELAKWKSEAEAHAKQAKADALKKVDQFDRKVEQEASKAKSGISSWFGGK